MKNIALIFSFIIIVSNTAYSQLIEKTNFGTVTATCSDGIYMDLNNFTVYVKVEGYLPGAPMGIFANDFTAKFITTFEAGAYFYDDKDNKVAFDEIENVKEVSVQIDYIDVEIDNFSNTLLYGKFNSNDRPYSTLIKGRTYTFNPYEWSKVIGDNWKDVLKNPSSNFALEITVPKVELTHYYTNVKNYFDQLYKKQEGLERIEELYNSSSINKYSSDPIKLKNTLDILNKVETSIYATAELKSKAQKDIEYIESKLAEQTVKKDSEKTVELSLEEDTEENNEESQTKKQANSDNATKAANSYNTCKELYRKGHLEAAKRCFEGHKAAYSCWDCNEYIREITEKQLYQAAGQTAEAAAQVWVNFAEKADEFTLYIGYNYSPDRGDKGLELQISPVYEVLYWGLNFTYLEKQQYNFPFMYDDYEIKKYWGVGTSAGLHGRIFALKRKGKNGKTRRMFSIEARVGYGIYYGWLGSETSFEYYPEAYISINNIVGIGAKYISSIDGWANTNDYIGNPTFIDNMDKNNYFKGIRYSLFINFGDIF
jgi:hypothetical protein